MSTICITGGHHNSALVVARELVARGHKVDWIGHRYAARGDKHDSAEYLEVTGSIIPFHDLVAGKLQPNLRELVRFPLGLYHALQILRRVKPRAILSFGGYLGGTVALAGKLLNIPIYLHEQTVSAGKANKLVGRLARKVYLTWRESAKYFDPRKLKIVGLPLREGILSAKPKAIFSRRKPTLIVMGGKQGAHSLNQFVFTHLSDLLSDYNIIHQTGTSSATHDYDSALALQGKLGSLADCYQPLGYIGESEIGSYLRSANLYLGRSGAHICYELGILGLPSILVPLLSTHDSEQHKNAELLVKAELAKILPQSRLTLNGWLTSLTQLNKLPTKSLAFPQNATQVLVEDLLKELR